MELLALSTRDNELFKNPAFHRYITASYAATLDLGRRLDIKVKQRSGPRAGNPVTVLSLEPAPDDALVVMATIPEAYQGLDVASDPSVITWDSGQKQAAIGRGQAMTGLLLGPTVVYGTLHGAEQAPSEAYDQFGIVAVACGHGTLGPLVTIDMPLQAYGPMDAVYVSDSVS